jgi:hypothetical protein
VPPFADHLGKLYVLWAQRFLFCLGGMVFGEGIHGRGEKREKELSALK